VQRLELRLHVLHRGCIQPRVSASMSHHTIPDRPSHARTQSNSREGMIRGAKGTTETGSMQEGTRETKRQFTP
jgi:hypothetical protein